jgi:hypothetical protein
MIKSVLKSLSFLKRKYGGINVPYFYFAQPMSSFTLHREDMGLCSLNYLIQGLSKWWIIIDPRDNDALETLIRGMYIKNRLLTFSTSFHIRS